MTYREILATPSEIGGSDGGVVHRLYEASLSREELRSLRMDGWRVVNFTSGRYANTTLLREAKKLPNGINSVFVKG